MKFKFLKDKKTILISAILFFSLVYFFVVLSHARGNNSEKNKTDSVDIIIDAGHGGEDGGAIGLEGTIEKDINLAISLKLKDFFEAAGHKVIMTRESDTAIYDDSAKTLREKKRSDLRNRKDIMNKNEKDEAIFVSIHQNKFTDEKYCGTQIFYSLNNQNSQILAEKIKQSVTELLQPENKRELKPANNKIFLLHNAKIPAVIVECGFLSNAEEVKKLRSEKYQSQMAFSIFCGITNYLMNNS